MNTLSGKYLLSLLGSFWTRVTASKTLVSNLLGGLLASHAQSEQKATELVKSVSNLEITAGTTSVWDKFIFSDSTFQHYNYGEDLLAKFGYSYFYGETKSNRKSYILPNNIISIPFLYSGLNNPGYVLTSGIDYIVTPGRIVFKKPLEKDSIALFGRNVVRDTEFVYRQLGYALGLVLADSVFRQIPLAELWRMYTYGPNYYNLMRILAIASNTALCKNESEVVEGIVALRECQLIITDLEVYVVPTTQKITVAVGAKLKQADILSSGMEVLHDKAINSQTIPQNLLARGAFKYGGKLGNLSKLLVVKLDLVDSGVAVIKYFKNILPVATRLVLFANKTVNEYNLPSNVFDSTGVACVNSKRTTEAEMVSADFSIINQSRLKYAQSGQ